MVFVTLLIIPKQFMLCGTVHCAAGGTLFCCQKRVYLFTPVFRLLAWTQVLKAEL